jgi:formate dehydrogenase maturation protein FdhE
VRRPVVTEAAVERAFQRRAARADLLAAGPTTAAEPLRFAAGLYRAQGRLAATIESAHAEHPLAASLEEDADRFVDRLGDVLRFAVEHGPPVLAEHARIREAEDRSRRRSRLLEWWSGGRGGGEDYLSRALLRPYVEALARLGTAPLRPHRPGHCPFCGGPPWIAARRGENDGTRRLLGCALCGGEWPLGRVLCPSCAEDDPSKLPAFQSPRYPAVRIEACETCRRYVKSIDLTVDARAIPEVDDLVSLGMDLWAAGRGFARIEPGLAGDLRPGVAGGGSG